MGKKQSFRTEKKSFVFEWEVAFQLCSECWVKCASWRHKSLWKMLEYRA
jgi:hypothetical protein